MRRQASGGSDDGEGGDKKLQNQFSFVERATQTMNNAMKVIFFGTSLEHLRWNDPFSVDRDTNGAAAEGKLYRQRESMDHFRRLHKLREAEGDSGFEFNLMRTIGVS